VGPTWRLSPSFSAHCFACIWGLLLRHLWNRGKLLLFFISLWVLC
jgi:hypothetical protein